MTMIMSTWSARKKQIFIFGIPLIRSTPNNTISTEKTETPGIRNTPGSDSTNSWSRYRWGCGFILSANCKHISKSSTVHGATSEYALTDWLDPTLLLTTYNPTDTITYSTYWYLSFEKYTIPKRFVLYKMLTYKNQV